MKKILLIAAALCTLTACTRPAESRQILEDAGYKNIQMTGYAAWGCDDSDDADEDYHDGFTAQGVSGQPVHGVVCGGIIKGSTIRILR